MAIEIVSYRAFPKNTLRGFLTVRLTSVGLQINEICLHEKNGKRWLSMPARSYEKKDGGGTAWAIMVEFFDKSKMEVFQDQTLAALDNYLKQ
ncbi:MAG: hypothetical protein ACP5IL_00895 [Syntrophobacteraceae bacterium]